MSNLSDSIRGLLDKIDKNDPYADRSYDVLGKIENDLTELEVKVRPKRYFDVRLENSFYAASPEQALRDFMSWLEEGDPHDWVYSIKDEDSGEWVEYDGMDL